MLQIFVERHEWLNDVSNAFEVYQNSAKVKGSQCTEEDAFEANSSCALTLFFLRCVNVYITCHMFISKQFCSCNLDWSFPKPYVRSALTNVKCIRLGVPFWSNFINHCGIQFAIPFFCALLGQSKSIFSVALQKEGKSKRQDIWPSLR